MKKVLVALVAMIGLNVAAASNAHAAYTHRDSDGINTYSADGSRVRVTGTIKWFSDWSKGSYVYRGQYHSDARVRLNKAGCLWSKVTWNQYGADVSWPPSAHSASTSDGWYRKCGRPGTTLSLHGVAHASRTLDASTVCVAYSTKSDPNVRRYQACEKNRFGGN